MKKNLINTLCIVVVILALLVSLWFNGQKTEQLKKEKLYSNYTVNVDFSQKDYVQCIFDCSNKNNQSDLMTFCEDRECLHICFEEYASNVTSYRMEYDLAVGTKVNDTNQELNNSNNSD